MSYISKFFGLVCWSIPIKSTGLGKMAISSSIILFGMPLLAQDNTGVELIIEKIGLLEKNKDPKCYATASRLEDFMYGTPLTDGARNLKIEIQKEVIFFLRLESTNKAISRGKSNINKELIKETIEEISTVDEEKNGDFNYRLTSGSVLIKSKDFRQYSSVSFGYRSLLSVEQDLAHLSATTLYSLNGEALEEANNFVNLLTLVVLKVTDLRARKDGKTSIDRSLLRQTWEQILKESLSTNQISAVSYPKADDIEINLDNSLLKRIVDQKLAAYQEYNKLAENVFLRNVQVYFAKQKWPKEGTISDDLRGFYLESLIQFTNVLILEANQISANDGSGFIRPEHVQKSGNTFLPSITNQFEDVVFFPNTDKGIVIESYDLDSFRDSGFHWRILSYALDDLQAESSRSIDPNAAEILVESIAQLGVLVLRLAGEYSKDMDKAVLDMDDLNWSFSRIQQLIDTYDYSVQHPEKSAISSSGSVYKPTDNGFVLSQDILGIEFVHRSADWLNRLIRSYTVNYQEGVVKLAIPPAFGGSGVAAEDINQDGAVDLLLLSGFGNKLLINQDGNGFKDISSTTPINQWNDSLGSYGEPRQPIIADFNNDGRQDIFITYVNEDHQLLANLGNDSFKNVSEKSNLGGKGLVGGPATALDFDNDGLLDIFIGYFGNYIAGVLPTLKRDNTNGLPNRLFKNMGDFVFKEVAFDPNPATNSGWTQALGHSDINQDGFQDIIVGNDFGRNKYYLNQGGTHFKEASQELGTDKPSYTMNVGITDLNEDRHPDFYISNIVVMQKDEKYVSPNSSTTMKFDPDKMANIRTIEANDLFLSKTVGGTLSNFLISEDVGRGYSSTGWSWDADFFDFDNDADQDLYCLNGMNDFSVYSTENPFYFERKEASKTIQYAESNRERNVFFVNEGGVLTNKAKELGADLNTNARSATFLDYDQDGDLDIIINNYHEKAQVLENRLYNTNQWIKIQLIGSVEAGINRDAIGSSLILNSTHHQNKWREIHSTSGYLSVHPKEQHFGLGADNSADIEIIWSNGERFNISDLQANHRYQIHYPNQVKLID